MNTQKQSLIAQITVAIIVGLLSSLSTGSLTAYVLTNKFDKKLDAHIIQNESEAAQIRRDIARIEQDNIRRDNESYNREKTLSKIVTDVAVIRTKVETL
jgi:siroheme synthase (precorrin-2 oxidase/ferrochelatase)